jgi:hypothetical protein
MASVFTGLAPIATSLRIVSQSRAGGWIDPWPVGNHAISLFSPSSRLLPDTENSRPFPRKHPRPARVFRAEKLYM